MDKWAISSPPHRFMTQTSVDYSIKEKCRLPIVSGPVDRHIELQANNVVYAPPVK